MKLLVSYSNCQGIGVLHFLRKTKLAETFEFKQYNNWQMIMGEQNPDDLMRDSARCDVFLYQTTPALKYGMLSTDEMCDKVVPKDSMKVAFGYGFNHGFFPLVHHGQWQTGEEIKRRAKQDPDGLLRDYDSSNLDFDCLRRFENCLHEQNEREGRESGLLPEGGYYLWMSYFIKAYYQKWPLFIVENHPCSAYFCELATNLVSLITNETRLEIPWVDRNEARLPCELLIHPSVVKELGLLYPSDARAQEYFRGHIQKLIADSKAA